MRGRAQAGPAVCSADARPDTCESAGQGLQLVHCGVAETSKLLGSQLNRTRVACHHCMFFALWYGLRLTSCCSQQPRLAIGTLL